MAAQGRSWRSLVGVVGRRAAGLEWTHEGFGPADGGYASVFFGWTAFHVLFVARHAVLARETAGDGDPLPEIAGGHAGARARRPATRTATAHDVARSALARPAGLEACSFYWAFLAGLGVLAWIVLYLI